MIEIKKTSRCAENLFAMRVFLESMNDHCLRLWLNNQTLVVENYFGAVSSQIREKILERELGEEEWKGLLFNTTVDVQKEHPLVKEKPPTTATTPEARQLPALISVGDEVDFIDQIAQDIGKSRVYVKKLLDTGIERVSIYDCAELAVRHGKKINCIISFYRKVPSTDVLSLILQAEEDTCLSAETLCELMVFCHGNDSFVGVIEEEVADVFSDAVEQISDFSDNCVRLSLKKIVSFGRHHLEDLIHTLQEETSNRNNEYYDRCSTRTHIPHRIPMEGNKRKGDVR